MRIWLLAGLLSKPPIL
ncbi:hypothetical protein AB1N83_012695 [Pleurotus pulmonarius]